MSKLLEYRELEKHLALQLQTLDFLKNDVRLKQELEFEARLLELLGEYRFGLGEITQILDPRSGSMITGSSLPVDGRKLRKLKVYRNPHTGEVLQTKGGNQRTLKQWKSQHGAGTVESWLTN